MASKQVVVIGAGQGGLSAALHLQMKGHQVLVLEAADRPGGKAASIETHGYRLDPGPSIIILIRFYEAVFKAAGRRMEDYLRFRRLDPFTRVFFQGTDPIDLPAGRQECLQTIKAIAPEDYDAVCRLLGILDEAMPRIERSIFAHPYHRPLQLFDPNLMAFGMRFDVRKSYKDLIDSWFQSLLLRAFFYGFPSYGGQTYDSKAPGALLIPYLMIQEGVWYPEGGVAAIPTAFEKLAKELGVEFRYGARVERLVADAGMVKAAVLTGGERVEAETFVSNVDFQTTDSWLGRSVEQDPSFSYFTVHWGVRHPLPMLRHHTLLVPNSFDQGFKQLYRDRRFPDEPIVYLNETSASDPQNAPPDCSNLFAVVTTPANLESLGWKNREAEYRDRVVRTLNNFGIQIGAVDFERIQTPVTFQERDGNHLGSLYGPDEKHRVFGMFPHRLVDDKLKNLFYVGGSVQPGAGLPMVTLGGKFVADLV